jgi:hypothetical protein
MQLNENAEPTGSAARTGSEFRGATLTERRYNNAIL